MSTPDIRVPERVLGDRGERPLLSGSLRKCWGGAGVSAPCGHGTERQLLEVKPHPALEMLTRRLEP